MGLLDTVSPGQEFRFSTGQVARTLSELYTILTQSPNLFVEHVSISPDLSRNDFAQWVIHALHAPLEGEKLVVLHDYMQFMDACYTLITASAAPALSSTPTAPAASFASEVAPASTTPVSAPVVTTPPVPVVTTPSDPVVTTPPVVASSPDLGIDAEISSSLDDEILGNLDSAPVALAPPHSESTLIQTSTIPHANLATPLSASPISNSSPSVPLIIPLFECETLLEPVLHELESELFLIN